MFHGYPRSTGLAHLGAAAQPYLGHRGGRDARPP
jgi:hypothetical protein